jgi:hypothetical protein
MTDKPNEGLVALPDGWRWVGPYHAVNHEEGSYVRIAQDFLSCNMILLGWAYRTITLPLVTIQDLLRGDTSQASLSAVETDRIIALIDNDLIQVSFRWGVLTVVSVQGLTWVIPIKAIETIIRVYECSVGDPTQVLVGR